MRAKPDDALDKQQRPGGRLHTKTKSEKFWASFFFRVKVLFFGAMALRNPPEIFRVKGLPDRLQNGFVIIIKKLALTS